MPSPAARAVQTVSAARQHQTAASQCALGHGAGGRLGGAQTSLFITELVSAVPEAEAGSADGQRRQFPAA